MLSFSGDPSGGATVTKELEWEEDRAEGNKAQEDPQVRRLFLPVFCEVRTVLGCAAQAGNYVSKNEWRPQIEAPLDSSRFQLFARVTRLVAAAGGGGGGEGSHKKVVIREGGMENALYADFQRRRELEGGIESEKVQTPEVCRV